MTLRMDLSALRLGDRLLIGPLQIEVPAGVVHTVMGPSGCGKSSLLAALCGTLAPPLRFEGSVLLDGQPVHLRPTALRRIGLLLQDDLLFAHLTVRENLLFAVPPGPRVQREARVRQALQSLEVLHLADADPATLSGGQRSRVALMRAMLAEPRALLLDEPFSRLDAALRARVREHVFASVRERGIPALLVTHDEADIANPAHLSRLDGPPA